MANLVRLNGDRVELPHLSLSYSITPPQAVLQEGLAAAHSLREDPSYQTLPLKERQEISRFMGEFGGRLFRMLFPEDAATALSTRWPLLLETGPEWQAFPWEWVNDGERWWALGPGLVRFVTPPEGYAGEPPPPEGRLRALAVSANPLPHREDGELFLHEARLGTRFIAPNDPLAGWEGPAAGPQWRALEHASAKGLEEALAGEPELLYFNGFSGSQGWFLESPLMGGQPLERDWVNRRLGRAAMESGLRVLVLNDSQGLLEPLAAAGQSAALLRAGVPGLIRMEGRQGRAREQDYLRTLATHLHQGEPLPAAHLAGVRRLHRRAHPSWDWSFFRLYLKALPRNGTPVSTPAAMAPPGAVKTQPPRPPWPRRAPPPPLFARRRRTLGRRRELEQLGRALQPGNGGGSPLVFLNGPAGSGKSVLAIEAARRMQRVFSHILCLPARELLPLPSSLPGVPEEENPPPPALRLVGELIRRTGAQGLLAQPWETWVDGLKHLLADSPPHLLILDALERQPGYEEFCRLLATFPANCRVLLVTRSKPPLLAGPVIRLEPLGLEDLAVLFDSSLVQRIDASPLREPLAALCGRDLLSARLLWRLPRWPRPAALAEALEASPATGKSDAPGAGGAMAALLVGAVLEALGREARAVLEALTVFSFLLHRDLLGAMTNLEGRALDQALTQLQWAGVVDAFDGESYFLLHPRLQGAVARHLVTPVVWRRLRTASVRVYQGWLARLGGEAEGVAPAPARLGWETGATSGPLDLGRIRIGNRLGRERAHLAELAGTLAEEEAWAEAGRLGEGAAALGRRPGMEDVARLLYHSLLAAGTAVRNTTWQATALNGLARGLLARDQARPAQALLERALDLLGKGEDWPQMAECYLLLSQSYENLGRAEAAVNMLYSAVELARQLDNPSHLGAAVRGLVRIWTRKEGGAPHAERFLGDVIHHTEERGRAQQAAEVKNVLADLHLGEGRPEKARELFQGVLHTCRAGQDTPGVYRALLRLAECSAAEGEQDDALDLLLQARQPRGPFRDGAEEARVLEGVCLGFAGAGRLQDALEGYLLLREILAEAGNRAGLAGVLDTVGGLYFQLGEQAKSTRCYQESLELKATVPHP